MSETPADWVLLEAAKRSYFGITPACDRALCDMIAKYEQPPVDPLRKEAIELDISEEVDRTDNQVVAIRNGMAGQAKIALVERALRRGMELAKERQP